MCVRLSVSVYPCVCVCLQTSDIGLTATVGDNSAGNERKFELWFRRQSPGVTLTLQAPSLSVKRAWLAEISCLLWRQAIQNRERRRSETVNRRHDVLLPARHELMSADTDSLIRDRFVAISIAAAGGTNNQLVLMFFLNQPRNPTLLLLT